MKKIKVLVACEFSGIVRDSFKDEDFDVISCDLEDTERPGNHYKGDMFDIIGNGFDVLLAFPPCTYLSSAGLHHEVVRSYEQRPAALGRVYQRKKAVEFFLRIWNYPIKYKCLENPAGYISSRILKPSQIIHPYYFGSVHKKRTCLWLDNLPLLQYEYERNLFSPDFIKPVIKPLSVDASGKNRFYTDFNRTQRKRSTFHLEVAQAMANQWKPFLREKLL